MEPIIFGATGPAVIDIQRRLVKLALLSEAQISGRFDEATAQALSQFALDNYLEPRDAVDDELWSELVAATYELGDRTLYLRMPHIYGSDVLELQHVLGALGFEVGNYDGIFGAYTEMALRKFQVNMGLPSDGIAGAYTYATLRNLHHSWEGKEPAHAPVSIGYARAADVLETYAVCLFGIDDFTRDVAARMSNLALATNPASKIVSAGDLSVAPSESMLLIEVAVADRSAPTTVPCVDCSDDERRLVDHLRQAIEIAWDNSVHRLRLVLPSETWEDAGASRSAQHFAILLLDALCQALEELSD